MENNNNYRSKAFLISLTLTVVVLEQGMKESLGAPVPSSPCTNASVGENSTTTATELLGDEFADVQQLRSGLRVLNAIVVSQYFILLVQPAPPTPVACIIAGLQTSSTLPCRICVVDSNFFFFFCNPIITAPSTLAFDFCFAGKPVSSRLRTLGGKQNGLGRL